MARKPSTKQKPRRRSQENPAHDCKPVSSRQPDAGDGASLGDDLDCRIGSFRRTGRPPLRCRAERIEQCVMQFDDGYEIEVGLHRRSRGGWLATLEVRHEGSAIAEDALAANRIDALIDALPSALPLPRAPSARSRGSSRCSALEIATEMIKMSRLIELRAIASVVAGDALHSWMRRDGETVM